VGIEEELMVVGAADKRPFAAGGSVVAEAAAGGNVQFEAEFKREQAELGSTPSESIAELGRELNALRSRMMDAAHRQDAEVVAIASSPFKVRPTLTEGERYAAMTERFGLLARQQLTCGQHVHISIDSPVEGVAVLDRIRPWLAVLTAISGNSPFWHGEDSGYSSYRSVMWSLWPTAGPTDAFGSVEGYERTIRGLLASGAAMDMGMMYFDARLSARYPTVEVRVPDVCTDVGDALLIAALARALVDTAAAEWAAGRPPVDVSVGLLRAAAWGASRSGMSDNLVNTATTEALPAWDLLDLLVEHVGDALTSNGDATRVVNAIARIKETGTGSEWQRRSYARRRALIDVVEDASQRTVGGGSDDV
jgi:carboxylate-amine ligase